MHMSDMRRSYSENGEVFRIETSEISQRPRRRDAECMPVTNFRDLKYGN